jgi:SAM-dependent methyltransferase
MSHDYVLGTHDEEVARLALQHRVWRPEVLSAWHRAGFAAGQTIVDIGSGPGNASLDLAEIVGVDGRVIALEKSRRFLDVLIERARERGVTNIRAYEIDLDGETLTDFVADAAWCRWVLTFLRDPRALIAALRHRLKPGGVFVLHEYFDYATWRTAPPSPQVERFVDAVMRSWRESGGDPDLGLMLPNWLNELGFDVHSVRAIVDVAEPGDPKWQWLAAFFESGSNRLVSLGAMTVAESAELRAALRHLESIPCTRMITPGLFEIVASRR